MTGGETGRIRIPRDRTRLYQSAPPSAVAARPSALPEGEDASSAPALSGAVVAEPISPAELSSTGSAAGVRAGSTADRAAPSWEERGIVAESVALAMGAGMLVPVPILDGLAVLGIQLRMVARLAAVHGREFRTERARSLVLALAAGVPTLQVSWLKLVPGIGTALAAGPTAVTAGALTYAVGRVFSSHFAGGGSLEGFPIEASRVAFHAALEEGLGGGAQRGGVRARR